MTGYGPFFTEKDNAMSRTVIGYDQFKAFYKSKCILKFHFGDYSHTSKEIKHYRKDAKAVEDTLSKRFAENALYKADPEGTVADVLRAFRNSYRNGDGPNLRRYEPDHEKAERKLSSADYAYRQIAVPSFTETRWISVSLANGTVEEYFVLWEPEKFFPASRIELTPDKFTL